MPVFIVSSLSGLRPLFSAFIGHHCHFVLYIRREFTRVATEFQERGNEPDYW